MVLLDHMLLVEILLVRILEVLGVLMETVELLVVLKITAVAIMVAVGHPVIEAIVLMKVLMVL